MSGAITLDTHIQDIVNLFNWEEIENAVLVGHSYGGWVISGAVERLENQVSALAYLDAFLPNDGQRGIDFVNDVQRASIQEAQARGDVSRSGPTSVALKIQDPDDAAWVDSKITPHPIGVSLQPIRLTGVRERISAKLYVRTPLFPSVPFDAALAQCQADAGWRTAILDGSGHDPMIDQSELVYELLEALP